MTDAIVPLVRFSERVPLGFEISRVSTILGRTYTDHSPTEHHRAGFCCLIYWDSGHGTHTVDFKDQEVKSGDIVLVANGQTQRFHHRENFDGHIIMFTEDFLFRKASLSNTILLNLLFPLREVRPIVRTDDRTRRSLGILLEEWSETDEFERGDTLRALLDYLLLQICRLRNESSKQVNSTRYFADFSRFFALIKQHHRTSRNAKDYAGIMEITYKHLNTICKNTCGRTAKQAIDDFLILEAKRELAVESASVEEISIQFGFDETTNFIKYFKKHSGLTPVNFRERLREVRN